jgi:peptidoglycan/LPS O-acetylase OafA/YrhL
MIQPKNNFKFLRLFFACLVIVSHGPELYDGNRGREILSRLTGQCSFGDVAVWSFFVISGYLVAESWRSSPRLGTFLEKRIRRIYPGYLVAVFVSVFVLGPFSRADYLHDLLWPLLLKSTVLLRIPLVPPVFPTSQPQPYVNGSLWSIHYEAKCYLILAVLGLLGLLTRPTIVFLLVCLASVCEIGCRSGWLAIPFSGPILDELLLIHASFFLFGVGISCLRDRVPWRRSFAMLAVVILALAARFGYFNLAWLIAGSYLIFYVAFTPLALLRPFDLLPDISYGIYLYSWPWFKVLIALDPSQSIVLLCLKDFFLSLACGYLSWICVERPCLPRARLEKERTISAKELVLSLSR